MGIPTWILGFITFWFVTPFTFLNLIIEIIDGKPVWDFFWEDEGDDK